MRVTAANFDEVIQHLCLRQVLSLDTETTGLEETDVPFAMIIADSEREFYFDERIIPDFWRNPSLLLLFSDATKTWLFQNAKFDLRMLLQKSLHLVGTVSDIAIAARLRNNKHFGYSLDNQAKREGMAKDDKVKAYIKDHGLFEERRNYFGEVTKVPRYDWVPVDIMESYACMDARLTFDLHHIHIKDFDEHDWRVMRNEQELTKVCFQMERTGVLLNVDYTMKGLYYEKAKYDELVAEFRRIAGAPFVNSAKSIGKCLRRCSLPTTDAGNPSLTDDVIEALLPGLDATDPDAVLLRMVQSIRFYDKRISTYYTSYLNAMDRAHIIHPTMWQAGTTTGRFSYSDPNLQNIPKEEDSTDAFVIRGCFCPRPGNLFVSLDYSQMEYRMCAAYANEADIVAKVMAGADFHQATADLLGIKRKQAKTVNFAVLYGAGVQKLGGMLGVSESEARRIKDKYFLGLPKVEQFIDRVIGTGKSRGYVHNWLGRRLRADYEHCYALPNHLIQGGGADVVKVAMVQIAKEFPELKMILQIHDQLVFDLSPEQLMHVPRIKEIMESVFPSMNGMKLTVDVSWSAVSLAERDMQKGLPNAA